VYFVASDGPLESDILGRIEAAGVRTRIVNRNYLAATLAPDRLADMERAVARPAEVNTDQGPVLYYYEMRRWLSQFRPVNAALGAAAAVLLAVYLVRLGSAQRVIFAAGFAASAVEIVLLIGFQALYGSVYKQVGFVVTVFMAGLACGAWLGRRRDPQSGARGALSVLAGAIAALSALIPLVLRASGALDSLWGAAWAGQGLILLSTFLLACLVGGQFPLAASAGAGKGPIAARLFSADLAGACVGAFLVSSLLIPLIGLPGVCLLTAGLNGLAAALPWAKRP
jgi:spermidine synthase